MPKICRWGNSLGLRLPKEIAAAAGLVSGDLVRVRLMDCGALMVTPIVRQIAITDEVQVTPKKEATW
jgi:antitoxin component of MazEF toxin-antitoxin module